jgi:hypothetical protein
MSDTMSFVEQRIRDVLLGGWFTRMAIRYCGKDYGDERINQYRFYRTVYGMEAARAWHEVARFHEAMQGTERWVNADAMERDSG